MPAASTEVHTSESTNGRKQASQQRSLVFQGHSAQQAGQTAANASQGPAYARSDAFGSSSHPMARARYSGAYSGSTARTESQARAQQPCEFVALFHDRPTHAPTTHAHLRHTRWLHAHLPTTHLRTACYLRAAEAAGRDRAMSIGSSNGVKPCRFTGRSGRTIRSERLVAGTDALSHLRLLLSVCRDLIRCELGRSFTHWGFRASLRHVGVNRQLPSYSG